MHENFTISNSLSKYLQQVRLAAVFSTDLEIPPRFISQEIALE